MNRVGRNVPRRCSRFLTGAVSLALVAGISSATSAPSTSPTRSAPLPTLTEARQRVRMMDDIYVTGVLATHKMYVRDPGTPAAVTWAKQVFRGVRGKGWPEARILNGADRPLNPENDPTDAFEREAVAAFRAGKRSVERVEGGTLRYATPIHVVDESCIQCHVRAKRGDLLGGISYRALFAPARK